MHPSSASLSKSQSFILIFMQRLRQRHGCQLIVTKITCDTLEYGHEWVVKWGPLEIGNILDRERLEKVIKKYSSEGVKHFAAYAYIGESVEKPEKYYRNNVVGTLTLLESMTDNNIQNIIFWKTCATYGIPESIHVNEDHPQNPINSYGSIKFVIERILKDFDSARGIRFVVLRYFNAAGTDLEGQIGEDHDPETYLIPLANDAASGKSQNIKTFGTDYNTPDGTCIRDYIHVS